MQSICVGAGRKTIYTVKQSNTQSGKLVTEKGKPMVRITQKQIEFIKIEMQDGF